MAAYTVATSTCLSGPAAPPLSALNPPRRSKSRNPASLHLASAPPSLARSPSTTGFTRRNAVATDKRGVLGPWRRKRKWKLVCPVFCCAESSDPSSSPLSRWLKQVQQKVVASEGILRIISGATSSPICQFIESPVTILHSVDPRIKLVRSAALGIVARRINWQKLTPLETLDIFVMYVRRIFKNIFNHAEQISQAMIVRGFRGDCNAHKIYLDPNPSLGISDLVSLFCLMGLVAVTVLAESLLV